MLARPVSNRASICSTASNEIGKIGADSIGNCWVFCSQTALSVVHEKSQAIQ
jgi:hypothetical protein